MKTHSRIAVLTVCTTFLMVLCNSSPGASIGVNFSGRDPGFLLPPTATAGVVPQANWNNVPPAIGDVFAGTTGELKDAGGGFTAVTMNFQCNDSWHNNSDISVNPTPDDILMKGIIKANPEPDLTPANNTDRMVFTFNGLGAGPYTVLVYNLENDSANGAYMSLNVGSTTYYISQDQSFNGVYIPASSTDPNNYEYGPNYAGYTNVTPTAGAITITAIKRIDNPQVTDGIGICAIQLVTTAAIPPNTTAITITNQPKPLTVGEGEAAVFTVGFTGPGDVQWQRNGVDIAGATGTSYTIIPTPGDTGAKFKAKITNNLGTVTSDEVALTVVAAQLTQGFASYARWENIGNATGQGGLDATVAAIAAGGPTYGSFVGELGYPQTNPDLSNFGGRLTGWIKPTETGDYDFFIRSDDPSAIWLNSVAAASGPNALPNPATDTYIAAELGCCNGFAEPSAGTTRTTSTPIHLEAGKLYGFTVLYKEAGGGDYVFVAWRKTTDTTPASGLPTLPGQYLWTMVSPAGKTAGIETQPQSVSVAEGQTATFSLSVTSSPSASSIQWMKNGTAISGATATSYTTPPTVLATDNGAKFKAQVLTLIGPLMTAEATLTVTNDLTPPVALSAGAVKNSAGTYDIGIRFNEVLDAATATNKANYTGTGITASDIYYIANTPGVILRGAALTPGTTYTVTVKNVKDVKGNTMVATDLNFTVSGMTWDVVGADELGLGFPAGNAVVAVGPGDFDVYSDSIAEWATYDEATFVYEQINGDFDKRVRVEYQDASSQWARAGIIVRDSTQANFGVDRTTQEGGAAGRYQKIHVNPVGPTLTGPGTAGNNSHETNRRLDKGGATSNAAVSRNTNPAYPNAWVRLQRMDQTNNLFRSDDGIAWVWLGRTTFGVDNTDGPMPAQVYVGPEFAPENGNVTDTASRGRWLAKFRSYSDTFGPAGAAPTRTYSIGLNFGADRAQGGIASALAATDVAGVPGVAQKNWNNINGNTGTQANLTADQGGTAQATTATVTWDCPNLWTTEGDGEPNNVLTGADHTLMHGYLDTGNATTTTVKIENIPTTLTANTYDVYVYFAGGVAGKGGGYRVVDGVSGAVLSDYVYARSQAFPRTYQKVMDGTTINNWGAGNYIVFRGLNAPSIQVEATTANGIGTAGLVRGIGTPRAPLNAVQLVAPGTAPTTGPTISIKTVGGVTTITFTGKLRSSATVNGTYTEVPNATSPYTVTPTGSAMFFRAAQ